MKYLKILGLAAISAAALMAFAGSASATTLTSPQGTTVTKGTIVRAESEGVVKLKALFGTIECKSSTEGEITNAGSSTETVQGSSKKAEELRWTECGPGTCSATTLKAGTIEVHTQEANNNGNGTLTGNGQEVETNCFGLNCVWTTSNTDLGILTGSSTGHATYDIKATIPRTGGTGGGFCGANGEWSGSYTVTTPSPLLVD